MTKEKNKIYLDYSERRFGGESTSDEPYSSRTDEEIQWSPVKLRAYGKYEFDTEEIEVDFDPQAQIGKPINIVIVKYSTGDTFGHSYGNAYIIGAYTDEESKKADKIAASINNDSYGGYKPWSGYFERLQDCYVETMTLEGEESKEELDV